MNKRLSFILFGILLLIGCAPQGKIEGKGHGNVNTGDCLQNYRKKVPQFTCLLIEDAQIGYTEDNLKQSFMASVKLIRDSAVILSVAPAMGIEAFRVIISKDSLWAIDRLNRRLYFTSLHYVSHKYGLPADISLLQNVLLGDISGLISDSVKYEVKTDIENKLFTWPDSLYTFPFLGYRLKQFMLNCRNQRIQSFKLASNGLLVDARYNAFLNFKKLAIASEQHIKVYNKGKMSVLEIEFSTIRKGMAGNWRNFGGRNYERIPLAPDGKIGLN